MYKSFLSVSGFTLLSRLTGFLRDIMLSGVLGAGMMMDAFAVALRLPNHFRAIFGEGAFNAAYVPTYLRVLERQGEARAQNFANQIFTLLLLSQVVLLALGWLFMPAFVDLLAPGFSTDPEKFALAVSLTRITFPYLFCVTLVTMHTATLNAHGVFAVPAFAPVLLNVVTMAFLARASCFPTRPMRRRRAWSPPASPSLSCSWSRRAGAGCWRRSPGPAGARTCARSSACSGRR